MYSDPVQIQSACVNSYWWNRNSNPVQIQSACVNSYWVASQFKSSPNPILDRQCECDLMLVSTQDNFPQDRNGQESFLCVWAIRSDRELTRQRKLSWPFLSWGKLFWAKTSLYVTVLAVPTFEYRSRQNWHVVSIWRKVLPWFINVSRCKELLSDVFNVNMRTCMKLDSFYSGNAIYRR